MKENKISTEKPCKNLLAILVDLLADQEGVQIAYKLEGAKD